MMISFFFLEKDAEGNEYYVNADTDETTWVRPADLDRTVVNRVACIGKVCIIYLFYFQRRNIIILDQY